MGWPPTQPTPRRWRLLCQQNRPKINRSSVMSARRRGFELGVFNAHARRLAERFWPARSRLSCRGLPAARQRTGKRRSPDIGPALPRPQCRARIARETAPLVAPSANPSGQLSPSQARHVSAHLPDIDVLDGGACTVGLESTIIGCLEETPTLLRVGGLSRNALETCLNRSLAELPENADRTARLAPGRMLRHYAPRAPLCINGKTPEGDYLLLGFGPGAPKDAAENLSLSGDLNEAAANLFDCLHRLDARALAEKSHRRRPRADGWAG